MLELSMEDYDKLIDYLSNAEARTDYEEEMLNKLYHIINSAEINGGE